MSKVAPLLEAQVAAASYEFFSRKEAKYYI